MRLLSPLALVALVACTDYNFAEGVESQGEGSSETSTGNTPSSLTSGTPDLTTPDPPLTDTQGTEPDPEETVEIGDTAVDTFELDTVPVDIAVYGDTSGSMATELTRMGDHVGVLTDSLEASGIDWQIIAVTGPSGCGVNGIMSPSTPDLQDTFTEALLTEPPGHDDDEAGLQNIRNAVQETGSGDCNDGFLRSGSLLHVVYISDEDDESPGDSDDDYWGDYLDDIVDVVGASERVLASAVADTVPGSCSGAESGHGYWETVQATGGAFLRICDDWANELELIAEASEEVWVFELSHPADPETLVVTVNGTESDDYRYEAEASRVVFESNAPRTGDEVEISYTVIAD